MDATVNNDPWANWRRRLAGDKSVPTYETEPDQGYYRVPITQKTLGGATQKIGWRATAYFYDAGALHCVVDGQYVSPDRAIELWLWCVKHPITEEQYRAVAERGEPWFDAPQTGVAPSNPAAPSAGIGHNQPPVETTDPLAELRETIENAVGSVKGIKVTTDDEAAKAQGSRARLLELSGDADKRRVKEKQPFLDGGREVDAKYMPLVTAAKDAADGLRKELSAHETRKLVAQREIERLAAAAAAKAEEDAAKARRNHKAIPPAPPPPPPVPERTSAVKGGYGKAASVQTVKFAVIEDWKAVAVHYSNVSEIQVMLQRLANADAKAGIAIPGAKIDEKADVR
jgi:hypothetical protein